MTYHMKCTLRPTIRPHVHCVGYLEEELKKVNIELVPGGNVGAPDPQDMIDLEVSVYTCISATHVHYLVVTISVHYIQ